MSMSQLRRAILVVALPFLVAGCLVEIREVSDPEPELRKARAEVEELASRPGKASSLQVLVYDPGDRQLVRLGVPLWVVRKAKGHAHEIDLGDEVDDRLRDRLGRIRLEDLEKGGRGAHVMIDDEDGTRVLVWLR
jgi:hypothetical protein